MMKKNVLWMMSMLFLLAVGAASCSGDDEIDYYTAKVISFESGYGYASIVSAPTDSEKNRLPSEGHEFSFSLSDLPGQVYQEGGMISFRIKEAHPYEGYHDMYTEYWVCVIEPVK